MLVEILVALVALCGFVYWSFCQRVKYWSTQGIKTAGNVAFPMGNTPFVHPEVIQQKKNANDVLLEQYREFRNERIYGTYGPMGYPILMINDLDLVKNILVKDFPNFVDRTSHLKLSGKAKTDIYWDQQLPFLKGKEWKDARSTFTPIFTSGKMKLMVKFMEMVSKEMDEDVMRHIEEDKYVELKDLLGKFTMSSIAACAFGLDAESFSKTESKFVSHAKMIFTRSARDMFFQVAVLIPTMEKLFNTLDVPTFKVEETQFLVQSIQETLKERQKTKNRRNDLIDLMIDVIKKNEDFEGLEKYDETLLIANALIVLVAGYDTTAITLSHLFYNLAMNPEIQEKLREEIDTACLDAGSKFPDYTTIQELEYLEMVISETLRLYTPNGFLSRAVDKNYRIPGTDVTAPANSDVHIPVYGFHMDEQYYETPNQFNPEHFTKEAKAARHPFAYLPFGQGPRNCIGMRFALLQTKIGVVSLISKFIVKKCPQTPSKISFDPTAQLAKCKELLIVDMEKRDNPSIV